MVYANPSPRPYRVFRRPACPHTRHHRHRPRTPKQRSNSAARGEMAARKLIVFKHDSALGSQPAHKLFDAVKVERVNGESGTPASGFGDYNISVVSDGLNGVSVEELL